MVRSRCLIGEFTCKFVIDGGSCTNVASLALAERFHLPQRAHSTPYSLNWLDDSSCVKVTKHALVTFSLGELTDTVWCDIVPMTACQLLLGRPWQYDRKAVYVVREDTYTLPQGNVLLKLLPLPPPSAPSTPVVDNSTVADDANDNRKNVASGATQHESQTALPAVISRPTERYTNIDTQVEGRRKIKQQQEGHPKRPKHPDRCTKLKRSDRALHPQHHKHKKGRPRHKLPTSIHQQRPATMLLLNRAKKALQPTRPKGKKRRKLPPLHLPCPCHSPHWAHVENLRANSFLQGENDENLKGINHESYWA